MLNSVQDAWKLIEAEVVAGEARPTPLAEAIGRTLAEPVYATGDSPPFDKALMDGFAIRSADSLSGVREFEVVETTTAGQVSTRDVTFGTAIRIMTGAQLPGGSDCVVPVEKTSCPAEGRVLIEAPGLKAEWNLDRRGQAIRAGDLVMPAGVTLGPAQVGALAEMGLAVVPAIPQPTVSIVATGDELVPYHASPGPGQIRNSNEVMLVAQAQQAGARVDFSTIACDERGELTRAIRKGLESDFLVLSGGVSAGVLDLVPSVLRDCGCEEVFHGCNIKPGKPIWFGRLPAERAADGRPRWIFGLPGNPVSSMVCFELFVRTGIRKRRGISPAEPQMHAARLAARHASKDSRPTYFPAVVSHEGQGLVVRPLNWQGSFDLQTVALANGFVLLESAGERLAGEQVQVLRLDN